MLAISSQIAGCGEDEATPRASDIGRADTEGDASTDASDSGDVDEADADIVDQGSAEQLAVETIVVARSGLHVTGDDAANEAGVGVT